MGAANQEALRASQANTASLAGLLTDLAGRQATNVRVQWIDPGWWCAREPRD